MLLSEVSIQVLGERNELVEFGEIAKISFKNVKDGA